MPEGDTIFRAARTLHRALAGKPVVAFESVFPALTRVDEDEPVNGRIVERVEAVGKHILMRFSGNLILRTHMRMNGSWHIYRRGEPWQRSRRDMRIVVATSDFEAVAFTVPVAEFLTEKGVRRHPDLTRLGPDLLSETFDSADAVARMRARAPEAVGDVLLNQRVVAGIGNVFKSEVCWAEQVSPFTRIGAIDGPARQRIYATAQHQLTSNLTTNRRTTYRNGLAVYRRARLPCPRCGTTIKTRRDATNRSTYWCPACQPEAAATT